MPVARPVHPRAGGTTRGWVVLLGTAVLAFWLLTSWSPVGKSLRSPAGTGHALRSEREVPPATEDAEPRPDREPAAAERANPDPAPRLHARDPDEWQGMRVALDRQVVCADPAGCGLALACHDGRCGPCRHDTDCADGEACVLDHCLREANVACRTRSDCGSADELCVLNGYTGGDPRGNTALRSFCLAPRGGVAQREGEHAAAIPPPAEAREPRRPAAGISATSMQEAVLRQLQNGRDGDSQRAQPATSD